MTNDQASVVNIQIPVALTSCRLILARKGQSLRHILTFSFMFIKYQFVAIGSYKLRLLKTKFTKSDDRYIGNVK